MYPQTFTVELTCLSVAGVEIHQLREALDDPRVARALIEALDLDGVTLSLVGEAETVGVTT